MSAPAIGVIFHPKFPPETLGDFARRAELAGFDELWLWNDCFLPGAFTSAAIALSATHKLKVGIGLLPAPAYNPLFAAMDITTLARAFPGRLLPGFGHGVGPWMAQIGAAPKSSHEDAGRNGAGRAPTSRRRNGHHAWRRCEPGAGADATDPGRDSAPVHRRHAGKIAAPGGARRRGVHPDGHVRPGLRNLGAGAHPRGHGRSRAQPTSRRGLSRCESE